MKILTIGDIHGRTHWQKAAFGSHEAYRAWNETGAFPADMPDLIVFIGDYVDSFDVQPIDQLNNLNNIIRFKKSRPEGVILLLGNHDIQYIVDGQYYSGYQPSMRWDFLNLFVANEDLFQMAYSFTSKNTTHLWTHAGVTQGWVDWTQEKLSAPESRWGPLLDLHNKDITQLLNELWKHRVPFLWTCDTDSGGVAPWAGPLWVRPKRLIQWGLPGINQIVGHTQTSRIVVEKIHGSDNTVTLVDCLESAEKAGLVNVLMGEY